MAHTPGPWTVQDNSIEDPEHGQIRVDSDGGVVADCGVGPFADDESRANAHLIAAALEMVELLTLARSSWGSMRHDKGICGDERAAAARSYNKARALLARIGGE